MSLYNLLHGRNPLSGLWLGILGLEPEDVPRFRDTYLLREDDGAIRIAVYTRMGGGNRGHWDFSTDDKPGEICPCPGCKAIYTLEGHPLHLRNEDDDFDATYATYVFKVPDEFLEHLERFAKKEDNVPPQEKMRTLISKLEGGNQDDPDVKRAMEKMGPLMKRIAEALDKA